MPIHQILTANNEELDLFTGSGVNGAVPLQLLEDDNETALDLTGMTLKFQILSAGFADFTDYADAEIIVDETAISVVGDPTEGNITLTMTGVNIPDADIQRNAVLLIYNSAASNKPIALGFCNIRPGKRTAA